MWQLLLLLDPVLCSPPRSPRVAELPFRNNLRVPLDAPVIQAPFKVTPNEGGSKTSSVTYTWNKAELQAITKDFLNALEDPLGFANEFNLVIQTYEPDYYNRYQPIHGL